MKQVTKLVLCFGLIMLSLIKGVLASALSHDETPSSLYADVSEGKDTATPPLFGLDPEDQDNDGTGTPGLLKIDRVPNIVFGKTVASGLYQIEYARNTNPYLQVTDLRGSLGGWTVSAKISDFVSKRTASDSRAYLLSGAKLTLQQGVIEAYKSELASPPSSSTVELNRYFQTVMSAQPGSGQGIWASRWPSESYSNKKIKLAILPGTAEPTRNYFATVSWEISDVPRSGD